MSKDLKELEGKIGYKFDDFTLFTKAMIHSSYANEKHLPKYECNERLEFLGDAVLELVSSEFLFHNNPKLPEGELTKTRASMVFHKNQIMLCPSVLLLLYSYISSCKFLSNAWRFILFST